MIHYNMDEAGIWNLIEKYFQDTPHALVKHHIESYNYFFKNDFFNIFRDTTL
jgi:DNA-directed RNA polymerase beta subunit